MGRDDKMGKFSQSVKIKLRNWLDIDKGMNPLTVRIIESMDFDANVFKNRIWYRGDPSELHQFYTTIDDMMGNTKFWAATATNGVDFRKIHTGLPALIVDVLTGIVLNDMNELDFDKTKGKQRWEEMEKELPDDFWKDIFTQAMYLGDGAIKFSFHPQESPYPIPEFYPADQVKFEYKHGKIKKIIFKNPYEFSEGRFELHEIYDDHGIDYELYGPTWEKENLLDYPEFAHLQPIHKSQAYMMAVPVIFGSSPKYKGRGKSLFDGKEDAFDSFDEAFSQWIEALRDNRTKTFIPDKMIPRDPKHGDLLKPNTFDSRFIKITGSGAETASNTIDVKQGQVDGEGLMAAYMAALDLCLQGLISPATLGIDVKKMDNAEAQREKEKATLYTRNKIVKLAEKVIPDIISTALKIMDTASGKPYQEYEITCSFGEYANPSFESVVETVGKAKQYGVMSNERIIEEMYGDSLDDEEKKEEIRRLNERDGLIPMQEPAAVNEFDLHPVAQTIPSIEQMTNGNG